MRNEEIRRRTRITDITERIARMDSSRWTSRVLKWRPWENKRKLGRLMKRWADDILKPQRAETGHKKRRLEMPGRDLSPAVKKLRFMKKKKKRDLNSCGRLIV